MPTLRLAACPNLRCKVDCLVPDNLLNSSINPYAHTFVIYSHSLFISTPDVCARGDTTSKAFCLPIAIGLFQTGKSSKAFLINFWEQHCIDALYTKSRGALNWWCSVGRQFTADTCTSRFQIFPLKGCCWHS
jgi:hypothetical protein